ncbi:MAG: hypothetical protein R2705_04315 [Ilumatobacteraceae bacterium]
MAPPITPDSVCFSIRRFTDRILGLEDFAPDPVVEVLAELVDAMCNVVVSGATSGGRPRCSEPSSDGPTLRTGS